jgi:hypothetical protein
VGVDTAPEATAVTGAADGTVPDRALDPVTAEAAIGDPGLAPMIAIAAGPDLCPAIAVDLGLGPAGGVAAVGTGPRAATAARGVQGCQSVFLAPTC